MIRNNCRGGPPWPPVERIGGKRATEGRPYNKARRFVIFTELLPTGISFKLTSFIPIRPDRHLFVYVEVEVRPKLGGGRNASLVG